jgi:hypothetical protein
LCNRKSLLEKVQSGAENDPFDAVFITIAEGLPDSFLLRRLARDGDSCATSPGAGRVLLDTAKLDPLGRNEMARICEIEHAPELGVWIGFRNLEEREVIRVWRGEG